MRKLVLALLAATGCNWVFGIGTTDLLPPPDAIPPDAPYPRMSLTYRVLDSIPSDSISYPTIDGATVQVGAYDGTLVDEAIDARGTFAIPDPWSAGEYRIVYKLPNDPVAHEVQWSNAVVSDGGKLTVPVYGRLPRTAPPAGTGITINGTSYPASWDCLSTGTPCMSQPGINLTAYTTGTWSSAATAWRRNTKSVGIAATSLVSMDGALATPSVADEDLIVALSETGPDGNGVTTVDGYLAAPAPVLFTGYSPVTAAVELVPPNGNAATTAFEPQAMRESSRTVIALGALYNKSPVDVGAISGVILPTLAMPAMTLAANDGSPNKSVAIPMATMTTNDPQFIDCYSYGNPFTTKDFDTGQDRPPAMLYQQFRTRPAHATGTPALWSGFQAITLKLVNPSGCNATGQKPAIEVPVAIAGSAMFDKPLTFDDTAVTVKQNGFQDLTFSLDKPGTTDDCVVTTYHVTTQLDAIRTILAPVRGQSTMTVHVPTSDFTAGETYAFGIVCRDSYPGAATGDYTLFGGYPQHESQAFPGTFVVSFQ